LLRERRKQEDDNRPYWDGRCAASTRPEGRRSLAALLTVEISLSLFELGLLITWNETAEAMEL